MANTVRKFSDLRFSNTAFGLCRMISELGSCVIFLHHFTFHAVDIHNIRCLAPYDHQIRTSFGTQVTLLAIMLLSEYQSTKFANILDLIGTLWETFCSKSIYNPLPIWVVLLGSLVFGKCISACISQLSPGWPDLSLPMDQHHSSLPHGRKLLRILSFSFLPPHRIIITM